MPCLDENLAVELIELRLAPDARHAVEQHVDACSACQGFLAGLGRAMASSSHSLGEPLAIASVTELEKGQVLGRYVVLDRLGAGGMGVVYSAYDPTLDRKVAIKLVRAARADERAKARLLREARAMARLHHPNVVTVHDVGEIDGQPFLAMDLLGGGTLAERLRARSRPSWREVLTDFVAAGRGLWAAHVAGLVHRDFKPDNVLLGANGRICVTDFGLASSGLPLGGDEVAVDGREETIGGTPGYMAPEHWAGGEVTAKSDQFSFAVALFEALYGDKPFAGDTAEARRARMLAGEVRPPPAGTRVPSRIRRVLVRALAAKPEDRYPSMGDLLGALEREPWPRRRAAAIVAAALGLFAGLGALGHWRSPQSSCQRAARELDEVWDEARRGRLERALRAAAPSFGDETAARVGAALDRYARGWAAQRTESCEATRVRGDQPDAIFALRTVCLDQRRRELDALAAQLEAADARVAEGAVSAAAALVPLAACADLRGLAARAPEPTDRATASQVDMLRRDLARVKATRYAGRLEEALVDARDVVARARDAGHRPTLAEALVADAMVEMALSDLPAAENALLEAASEALASKHDQVAAEAWAWLLHVALQRAEVARAASYAPVAQAVLQRIGGDDEIGDQLGDDIGSLLLAQDEPARACEHLARHLVTRERRLGAEEPRLASTLLELVRALRAAGDLGRAEAEGRRILTLVAGELGPGHPAVAAQEIALADTLVARGALAEAEGLLRHAFVVLEASHGRDAPAQEQGLLVLGKALAARGASAEAESTFRGPEGERLRARARACLAAHEATLQAPGGASPPR